MGLWFQPVPPRVAAGQAEETRLFSGMEAAAADVTQRIISWGQSRDGGELARGNRFVDTERFCKSQVPLNSRLGHQREAAGL